MHKCPYEIKWEKYSPAVPGWVEMDGTGTLPKLTGLYAGNLTPGQYRISVAPRRWVCTTVDKYDKIGLIKYITVEQNDDLVITNGPYIIPSQYDFTTGTTNL